MRAMSKYTPLIQHLQNVSADHVQFSLADLGVLIGSALPASAGQYTAWWHNSPPNVSHPWARDWEDIGWQAHPNLAAQTVSFTRLTQAPNWQKEVAALKSLGGSATVQQIHEKLVTDHGKFDIENVRKDLIMLSANDPKRRAYRAWEVRHGRPHFKYDMVFAGDGSGKDRLYELYDSKRHGRWGFVMLPTGELVLRRLEDMEAEVEQAGEAAYDPNSEAEGKDYVTGSIAVRRGGTAFRKAVLAGYQDACCISGCTLLDVLEAAHIRPYAGQSTNVLANSLLLRSDLHTLFDLLRLTVDPTTLRIRLHPSLLAHKEYAAFEGKVLSAPPGIDLSKALMHHWSRTSSWSQAGATPEDDEITGEGG